MERETSRYVFGPVMSGRLGRSLGLDLLGARICSMNCVYCESGALTQLTLARAPYVPADELLAELAGWEANRARRGDPLPDFATLGGLGEPTLNNDMPAVIAGTRRILPGVPVAVLTNASLMTDVAVRAELAAADVILPSLDALEPRAFARVNRAHPGLDPAAIAEGILAFRAEAKTKIFLEVLLAADINDTAENLRRLADYCARLRPDRVDVTTLSRPGTESFATPVDADTLAAWRKRLGPLARTEDSSGPTFAGGLAGATKKRQEQSGDGDREALRERILASLARRPQTAAQLAGALCAAPENVARVLTEILAGNQAEEVHLAANAHDNAHAGPATGEVFYQTRG